MTDSALLQRLQEALSPEYRVERELASGGMGRVFLAHELALDRPVAIKVMRPELATATAAESFLREARILASVRHPHIVAVHHAGESAGLFYYIMEFVEGETLADRLRRGPLPPSAALKLGRDLLDGLETVHRAGIVHRDIKPANVFLVGQRTLLADFGIARPPSEAPPGRRRTSQYLEGTPGYMAPEQMAGGPITPRTDLFAVGALIYEAYTGRQLSAFAEKVNWHDVPRPVAGVLRRAVALSPDDRWPDARSLRQQLWRTRTRRYVQRTALLTAGGVLAGIIGTVVLPRPRNAGASAGAVSVSIPAFEFSGPADRRWIADSLVQVLRSSLQGHADFRIADDGERVPVAGSLAVGGKVDLTGDQLHVSITHHTAGAYLGAGDAIRTHVFSAPAERWRTLADSAVYGVLLGVWDARSPLAASLPLRALPHSSLGLVRFLEAEQMIAAARWGDAYQAYLAAEETDSTCWLCSWRLNEVDRWLGHEHDPARVRRYLARVDSFPPWYQSLIRAAGMPLPERLDTLRGVTERSRGFFLGWFQRGDELFHRGPLIGHQRVEAITPLETAVQLRPDFGPAWEHLAWLYVAEGDSAGAGRALAELDRRGPIHDPFTQALRSLLQLGYAWRFLPEKQALALTGRVLERPTEAAYPDLGAGPRLLPSFDAPRGAIALGRLIALTGSRDLKRSGLIAQVLGAVATGDLGSARDAAHRLVETSPEPENAVFAAEMEGVIALVDSEAVAPKAAAAALRRFTIVGSVPEPLRRRAVWMTSLLARRVPGADRPAVHPLVFGQFDEARHLATFLNADSLARTGHLAQALALTDTIRVDSVARHVDPFYRTIARLERAGWRARMQDFEGARRELHWYQHDDLVGLPKDVPQAAEIDWAFGTMARWRLARLPSEPERSGEACKAFRAVLRHWTGGDPIYAARADTARESLQLLRCES